MKCYNKLAKIVSIFLLLLMSIIFVSCNFDESKNNFYGGEMLDEDLLESIRDALSSNEQTTSEKINGDTTEYATEITTVQAAEDVTIETNEDGEVIVYWLENGSVWHADPNCQHIKGKEYLSGTIDQAIENGMNRLCKSCED